MILTVALMVDVTHHTMVLNWQGGHLCSFRALHQGPCPWSTSLRYKEAE